MTNKLNTRFQFPPSQLPSATVVIIESEWGRHRKDVTYYADTGDGTYAPTRNVVAYSAAAVKVLNEVIG